MKLPVKAGRRFAFRHHRKINGVPAAAAAAAAVMATNGAHAQQASGVVLYGLLDTGVEYISHAGADGGVFRMSSGNLAGSRWGLRGKEDLGGGLSAVFVLESGYNSDSGTSGQGGRLFGRQAHVGLQGRWGAITLGRQNNTLYDLFVPFDPTRYASYGVLPQDPHFAGRADNAIKYTGKFSGMTVTGLYSSGYDATIANGSEVAGSFRIGQEMGAGVAYTVGNLSTVLAYDQRRGAAAATQGNIERRYAAGLLWSAGPLSAMAGYRFLQGTIAAPSLRAHLYWAGAAYQFTPALALRGGVYRTDRGDSPDDAISYAVSAVYNLSKRSELYANVSWMDNRGASALSVANAGPSGGAGADQTGVVLGVRHVF